MTDKKVWLITGAGRGMGADIAKAALAAGHAVVATGRNAGTVAKALGQDGDLLAVQLDVTNPVDAEAAVRAAVERFGRIDVLVNNAGMSPLYPSLAEVTEELYDKVLAVNLKGRFRLGSLAGARMQEAGEGCILNISSIAAVRPTAREVPYAAAKAGLNTLTKGLAVAYGPAVRVNAIMAGPFLTDVAKAWDSEAFAREAESIPLRRGGRPDEIVGAALYLTTRASSYCTGAVLTLDGGIT